jgi:hypothetical protein
MQNAPFFLISINNIFLIHNVSYNRDFKGETFIFTLFQFFFVFFNIFVFILK